VTAVVDHLVDERNRSNSMNLSQSESVDYFPSNETVVEANSEEGDMDEWPFHFNLHYYDMNETDTYLSNPMSDVNHIQVNINFIGGEIAKFFNWFVEKLAWWIQPAQEDGMIRNDTEETHIYEDRDMPAHKYQQSP